MQSVEKIDRCDFERLTGNSLTLGECPIGPVSLKYADALLEQIRREVSDKFVSIPRGGLEIGGVLFGRITEAEIRLLAFRPLEIEYLSGPSFVLSGTDEIRLAQLIEASQSDPELEGMEPVGWYHSHTRSGLSLSDADIAIHQRFFPHPEQVALVFRPHKFEPTEAGFFLRNADGSLRGDVPQAVLVRPLVGKDESKHAETPAPSPIEPLAAADVAVDMRTEDSPVEPGSLQLVPVHSGRAAPKSGHRKLAIAAVVAALLCIAAVMFLPTRSPAVRESAPMWVHLSDAGNQLTITWNRSSPAVAHARTAEILITDGGQQTARVPLDKESLSRGTILYARHSGNVEVRMRVQSQADRLLEEVVRFIGPEVATQPSPAPPQPREEPDPELIQRLESQMERLKKELASAPPDGMRARSVPVTGTNRARTFAPVAKSTTVPAAPNILDISPPALTAQTQVSPPSPSLRPRHGPPSSDRPPEARHPGGPSGLGGCPRVVCFPWMECARAWEL